MGDTQAPARSNGTVRAWHGDKGFGFIMRDDAAGPDLFVHWRSVRPGHSAGRGPVSLEPGQRVEFTVVDDARHPGREMCHDVVILSPDGRAIQPQAAGLVHVAEAARHGRTQAELDAAVWSDFTKIDRKDVSPDRARKLDRARDMEAYGEDDHRYARRRR